MTRRTLLPPGTRAGIGEFDRWVDDHVERLLRHRHLADRVFYAASAVGDHGSVWMALAGLQALRRRDGNWSRPLLRAVVGLMVESVVVNGPLKWIFRRQRPVQVSPRPRHLRQPRSSSFPSGHASAAFFGAALLRDNDPWWPAYYVIAVIVAASRVHVRIHHASDVVGGIVVGTVLGEVTRALVPVASPLRSPATAGQPAGGEPAEAEPALAGAEPAGVEPAPAGAEPAPGGAADHRAGMP